jgi:hypothetical protein
MKFLVVVLLIRVVLIWMSRRNEEINKNENDVQQNVLHPAAHQLR